MKSHLIGALCAGFILFGVSTFADAAFIGRLETSPGSGIFQAYYDDQQNITWTADANINGTNSLADTEIWLASLSIDGITGWRLPNMDVNGDGIVVDCSSVSAVTCLDNEFGYMFWQNGVTDTSPNPFSNIQFSHYWSGTDDAANTSLRWLFHPGVGSQRSGSKTGGGTDFAWAVLPGDATVSAVPVPATVWLFGSGLFGLFGIVRKQKAT